MYATLGYSAAVLRARRHAPWLAMIAASLLAGSAAAEAPTSQARASDDTRHVEKNTKHADSGALASTPVDNLKDDTPSTDVETEQPPPSHSATVPVSPGSDLTVEEIKGRRIVNLRGDFVGDVSDVVIRRDGSEAGLVVEVGGIKGVGEKAVFVSFSQLLASEEDIVWQTRQDEEALQEELPEFEADQFVRVPEGAGA